MCGIAGILRLDDTPADRDLLKRMTDAIAHRGPDGEGQHTDGPLGLGHRRLAIVDLSDAGAQPMATPDGRYWITYNGEVYNHEDLREDLVRLGHTFTSETDTETVLHAFAAWGPDCVERFNGMFAFAIWDRDTRTLFLARDRYGIKPLYYLAASDRFHFASEIKALRADAQYTTRVDLHALREYFTFQNLYSDRTLFDGVRLLAPGHTLTLTPDGTTSLRCYWDSRDALDEDILPDTPGAAAEKVRTLFEAAVERQLMTDVPLGAHLSAGMDSGSIAAVAARHVPRLPTFTGGFDTRETDGFELRADEREGAEHLASLLRTEHYEMVMHAGDMKWVLPRLVWHLEDLRLGMSWPNYNIDRLASRFVKVALTGTGGDEVFGGYPWRYGRALDARDAEDFETRYLGYWQRLLKEDDHKALFRKEVLDATHDHSARQLFHDVLGDDVPADLREAALHFEFKTFLHGLLVIQDKISMAHGLESRVPFLDNDLVDYALRLPAEHKMGRIDLPSDGGPVRSNQGKLVLRRAMRGILPDEVLTREKHGFSAPDGSWYRGPSLVYVHETLLGEGSRCTEYLDHRFIKRLIAEHWTQLVEHRLLLWSLLSFEWWLRVFDPAPPLSPQEAQHANRSAPLVTRRARRVRRIRPEQPQGPRVPHAALPGVPARPPEVQRRVPGQHDGRKGHRGPAPSVP